MRLAGGDAQRQQRDDDGDDVFALYHHRDIPRSTATRNEHPHAMGQKILSTDGFLLIRGVRERGGERGGGERMGERMG